MNFNITQYNLLFVVVGIQLLLVSLHYKDENKKIEYGILFGFAKNLNRKGKLMFFLGMIFETIGVFGQF